MHAFWGVGQMSFVKHAIFVGQNAPKLDDYGALVPYILNRFEASKLYISEGICDQLDHASPNACFGGKAALDATSEKECGEKLEILSDEALNELFSSEIPLLALRQFYVDTSAPIVCVLLDKKELVKKSFERLLKFAKHFKIIVFLDSHNRLQNPYMLVWRVVNNIDAKRDIFFGKDFINENSANFKAKGENSQLNSVNSSEKSENSNENLAHCIGIDATAKGELEKHPRKWALQVDCTQKVIEDLIKRKLIDKDSALFDKFELF